MKHIQHIKNTSGGLLHYNRAPTDTATQSSALLSVPPQWNLHIPANCQGIDRHFVLF